MTDRDTLTAYLHAQIPLTQAMQLVAESVAPNRVALCLPLAANSNHKGTMFGGSLAALGTLACWALVHERMRAEQIEGELVVMRSEMDYLSAVSDQCRAVCEFEDETTWQKATRLLARRGKARLALTSDLFVAETKVATFAGDFAIVN